MLGILITLLTFGLILVCIFLIFVILMQRSNTNAGMGSAFGSGVTESTFGADTANVLTKATKYAAFIFMGVALSLYLLHLWKHKSELDAKKESLPVIVVPETPAPAEGTAAPAAPTVEAAPVAEPVAEAPAENTLQPITVPDAGQPASK